MNNFKNNQTKDFLKNREYLSQKKIKPGIYLLFRNDKVVYVGKSLFPKQRVLTHSNSSEKSFDSYYIIYCDKNQLKNLEIKYIQKYAPEYNKSLPYSKLYPCIGKTTKIKNNHFPISCMIINNKLYLDLSQVEFELIQKKKATKND